MSDVDKGWARAGMEEVREERQTRLLKFAFLTGFNIYGCPSYFEYYFSKSIIGVDVRDAFSGFSAHIQRNGSLVQNRR